MAKSGFIFGTVGAPLSTPPRPGGTVGGIARTAELDLGALELAWVQSVRVTEGKCAEIKATAVAQGVVLSVHAPYFINLNATAEEWPKSRKRLMDAAHYGHLAGATDIVFHPGSYFGATPCASAVALISAHLASLTRTDCTQASSSAPRPRPAMRAMPPTVPPGRGGVESGAPTVPKMNPDLGIGLSFRRISLKRPGRHDVSDQEHSIQ